MVTFNMSRSASSYESGIGRGMGFRDSTQDLLGFVHLVPGRARERIVDIASTQLPTGGAYHQYQPLTKRGNDTIGSGFNDDPLWLVLAVAAYLKETGDPSLLHERGPLRQCRRHRGAALRPPPPQPELYAGTPRAARATAHRPGGLERLPQPQLLFQHARRELPDHREQSRRRGRVSVHSRACSCSLPGKWRHYQQLGPGVGRARRGRALPALRRGPWSRTIGEHGWDGAWFRRAYDYFGHPVGSHITRKARSSSNRRGCASWEASGWPTGGRGRLSTACATGSPPRTASCSSSPPFTHYHLELGEITLLPPRLQGKWQRFLPHQPLGDDRRGACWATVTRPSTTTSASTPRRARR